MFGAPLDKPLTGGEKLKIFLAVHWRGILCVLVPVFGLPLCTPFPGESYQWVGFTLIVMAIYWVSECIPLPVTAFLPVAVFPTIALMTSDQIARAYFNDSIVMFLGSMILAAAVEQSGLHIRLALAVVRFVGYSHSRLLLGIVIITTFASMWITNTAATTMMVPIAFALLKVFENNGIMKIYVVDESGEKKAGKLTVCYFCSISYAASLGGVGTLVGTGTNLVFKGFFVETYSKAPDLLSFPRYMFFGTPLCIALGAALYVVLGCQFLGMFRPNSATAKAAHVTPAGLDAAKAAVDKNWKDIGPITFYEMMVVIVFCSAMASFFCRSPQLFTGWGDLIEQMFDKKKWIRDSACAMFYCMLMFYLPSNLSLFKNFSAKNKSDLPKEPTRSLLDWTKLNAEIPWSFTFLLGGGFGVSLAAGEKFSDLNSKIGDFLVMFSVLPKALLILIIIAFSMFVTNFASNVAVATVLVPLTQTMADRVKQNPLLFNLAAGISASFALIMPVGTPSNLVVQSAASIATIDFIKAGLGISLAALIIEWLFLLLFAPIVWSDVSNPEPDWK